jgi:hypothetical protein
MAIAIPLVIGDQRWRASEVGKFLNMSFKIRFYGSA